jgi:GNAT superfamily N-acetyltransferase
LKDKILKLEILPLSEIQLEAADHIFRLAFGTRNGLADPMKFDGDAARIKTRFHSRNVISLAAIIDEKLVGTGFGTIWGNFAWLGPLSVHPDFWNKHIAQVLLEAAIPALDRPTKRHQALFTVAESPKHLALYRKFGFSPWFLTVVMEKVVEPTSQPDYLKFSEIPEQQRAGCLKDLLKITNSLFEGLDLSEEILSVAIRSLGDTIIIMQSGIPAGFAICYYGPGTEAVSNTAYIKFGAVRTGESSPDLFDKLLSASEHCAAQHGLKCLNAGVNTGRRGAYGIMLNRGFRSIQQGIAMHRPDEPGYDRTDVYAIDDWR